ncbi:MAG: hypothetical protein AABY07_00650 [Nanoarchaeota archaeon]
MGDYDLEDPEGKEISLEEAIRLMAEDKQWFAQNAAKLNVSHPGYRYFAVLERDLVDPDAFAKTKDELFAKMDNRYGGISFYLGDINNIPPIGGDYCQELGFDC